MRTSRVGALLGASVASLAAGLIIHFEGNILQGYLDPSGIPTKCVGDTTEVIVGKSYSDAECMASLEEQIFKHAKPVLECTPQLKNQVFQLSAAISFAYNIGVSAYCKSDAARYFRQYDFKNGCRSLNTSDTGKPQWITSKGKVLPGLVKRRAAERQLCELGVL